MKESQFVNLFSQISLLLQSFDNYGYYYYTHCAQAFVQMYNNKSDKYQGT
jgi:hypothetical protein